MATKKKTAKSTTEKAAGKGTARKASAARKRITPSKEARGLAVGDMVLALDAAEVKPSVEHIVAAGGVALAAYREPLSGRAIVLAALPREAVAPTPFQRDLSPTHAKRLAEKIGESGSFLDPIIVVRGSDGGLWTPNGRHRLAAAKVLGLRHDGAGVARRGPRLSHPGAQHREGAQPQGEVPGGDPHLSRPDRGGRRGRRPGSRSTWRRRLSSRWGCATRRT